MGKPSIERGNAFSPGGAVREFGSGFEERHRVDPNTFKTNILAQSSYLSLIKAFLYCASEPVSDLGQSPYWIPPVWF